MQLSEKAAAFMAKNPTKLGTIGNRVYYEHPEYGDEVPMFFIENGRLYKSAYWDMESASDASYNNFF